MGSQKDVMELFAERDIRHMLPEYDGWKIEPFQGFRAPGSFYRISRRKWVGSDIAYVAVSHDAKPKDELIAALNSFPDDWVSITKKHILTPQATDISAVPPHVRVLLMTAFAFEQGELIWLTKKKYARQYHCEPVPVPAEPAPAPATSS